MRTMRRLLVMLAALSLPIVVVGVAVAIPDGACDDPKWADDEKCAALGPTPTTIVPPPPYEQGQVTGYHLYGSWEWDWPEAQPIGDEELVGHERLAIQAHDGEFVIGDAATGTIDQLVTIGWYGYAPVGPDYVCSTDGPVTMWQLVGSVFSGPGDPVFAFDPDVDADTAFVDAEEIPATGWTWTQVCKDGEVDFYTEPQPVQGELSITGSFELEACRSHRKHPQEWKVLSFEGSVAWTDGFDGLDHAAGFDISLDLEWLFWELADWPVAWPGSWTTSG